MNGDTDTEMPAVNRTEHFAFASDGVQIALRRWSLPEARAVLVIVHGYAEHSGRYEDHAVRFCHSGYDVWAYDHRGHGRSQGERAAIQSFSQYVDDFQIVLQDVVDAAGDRPVFIMGHSMGGLVVAVHAIEYGPVVAGMILSSTAVLLPDNAVLQWLISVVARIAPRMRTVRLNRKYLSRDSDVMVKTHSDPLYYRGRIRARLGAEIVSAGRRVRRELRQITQPLFIAHGTSDKITDAEGSRLIYRNVGSVDKTIRLYPGYYHETFNDLGGLQVMDDLITWMNERSGDPT